VITVPEGYPFVRVDTVEAEPRPSAARPARGRRMSTVEDRAIHPGENR
jgi:hypothetical protein